MTKQERMLRNSLYTTNCAFLVELPFNLTSYIPSICLDYLSRDKYCIFVIIFSGWEFEGCGLSGVIIYCA